MGLDHTRLTYVHQGLEQRLTGIRGESIREELSLSAGAGRLALDGMVLDAGMLLHRLTL